jgi:hypothetical protein
MKLSKPENDSYAAIITTISELHPFEGSDNIVGTNLFGFQAIVSKDTAPGTRGIFFPAETQLSEEYCYENNLHEHGNLNKDEGVKGYLGDNRRVRALRLRGNRSDCLFMPLSSLSYIKGLDVNALQDGETFDAIGDHPICNKYVIKRPNSEVRVEKNKDKFIRVDKKFLPENYDQDQWYKYNEVVPDEATVIITQKLHGTSIRVGNTIVRRKLSLLESILGKLGVKVKTDEFDYVFGSRRVIKDPNNPNQDHFYSEDIWTGEGKKLEGKIPENFLVYGELIGWTPTGTPIQRNYTYQVPRQTCDLYVYRVAFVNGQGKVVDLAWDQVVEFCKDAGLKSVPELWRGKKKDLEMNTWFVDKRFRDDGYPQAVPLDPESPVDEGVCVRLDGMAPYILKSKGPQFYEHETKMLDEEAEDLETEGSENV